MKNLASIESRSACVNSGSLEFNDSKSGEAGDFKPKAPPAATTPTGSASSWWDAHPADLPRSTILWDDDATADPVCDTAAN